MKNATALISPWGYSFAWGVPALREAMNLKVKAGILVRALDSVDLRATVSLAPSVSAWLGVELRLPLARPEVGPGGR